MRRDRRTLLSTLGTGLTLSLGGCLDALGADPGYQQQREDLSAEHDAVVGMVAAHSFVPKGVTIPAGGSVAWLDDSDYQHTVTAYGDSIPDGAAYFASGGFGSEEQARTYTDPGEGLLDSGDTYSHTFEVPGEYRYFCIPHEDAGMVGVVTVEE